MCGQQAAHETRKERPRFLKGRSENCRLRTRLTQPSWRSGLRASPPGFTLIEVIIALAIFGFVLVGLAQSLRFGMAARGVEDAQVAIGVDDSHRLVLRWTPHPNAVALGPPPRLQEIVLAEGVERIDLAYHAGASEGGKWSKTWTDGPLPAVVQLHFVLPAGKHRWPDMQIPTLLDTNGSF